MVDSTHARHTNFNISNLIQNRRTTFVRTGLQEVGLSPSIVSTLRKLQIEKFTPTQGALLAAMLRGKSVMVQTEPGTGKSFAAMLGSVHRFVHRFESSRMHVVIIVPTQALALQYAIWIREFVGMGRHVVALAIEKNLSDIFLSRLREISPSILVGTPRTVALVMKYSKLLFGLKLRQLVDTLIIDEVDFVLQQGIGSELVERLYRREREELPAQLITLSATTNTYTQRKFNFWTQNEHNVLRLCSSTMVDALQEGLSFFLYCDTAEKLGEILARVITYSEYVKDEKFRPLLAMSESRKQRLLAKHPEIKACTYSYKLLMPGKKKFLTGLFHGNYSSVNSLSTHPTLTTYSPKLSHALDLNHENQFQLPSIVLENRYPIINFDEGRGLNLGAISDVIIYGDVPTPAEFVHLAGRTAREGNVGEVSLLFTPFQAESVRHLCAVYDIPFKLSICPN